MLKPIIKQTKIMNIKIKKTELLKKLNENLTKHDKVYEEALSGYWGEIENTLNEHYEDAKALIAERNITNGGVNIYININTPTNNRESYEETIAMLNFDVRDEIELSQSEFNSYVLNKWQWSDQFLASNAVYASTMSLNEFSSSN